MENIEITTEYIKLQDLLKFAAAVQTVIQEGDVTVNGEVCTMRGRKLRPGDDVCFQGKHYTVTYAGR